MGNAVLSVDINASSFLRAYAHCRKQKVSFIPPFYLVNIVLFAEFLCKVASPRIFTLNINILLVTSFISIIILAARNFPSVDQPQQHYTIHDHHSE